MPSQAPNPVSFFATPDQATQIQDAELRRQMYADMLRRGQAGSPGTQMVGQVAIPTSWTQHLANLANVVMGTRGMREANADLAKAYGAQMEQVRRMMGGGVGGPSPASDPAQAPQEQSSPSALAMALQQGAEAGSVGPTNDNAQRLSRLLMAQQASPQAEPAQQSVAQPQPQAPATPPLNPMGLDPTIAAGFYMSDPLEYFKTIVQQQAPTELQKTARAAGLQPGTPQYVAAMRAALDKQNYIAPTAIRPGGGVQDPRTGAITTLPSAPPTGFDSKQNPDGTWRYEPVQGGTQAITASTAATEAGKAPYQMVEGFDPTTRAPFKNYAGNVLPLPAAPQSPGQQPSRGSAPVMVTNAQPRHSPATLGQQFPQQNYGPEALRILQDERSKATTPEDRAALDREIARVTPRVQQGGQPSGVQTGPSLGEGQGQTNAQNELSDAWKGQLQAHQTAQSNIATLSQMRGLTDQAITGYEPSRRQYLAQLGAFVGLPPMEKAASATDLFNKYGAQLVTGLASKGLNTDAARALVEAGSPNSKMQPAAAREAIDSLMSREQMAQARTQALQAFAQRRDAAGFQGAAAKFDQAADPRVWQWLNIRDPKERAAFASKTLRADPRFAARIQDLESLGVISGTR